MKVEIEVELPEAIAKEWEVVAVRRAEVDECIAVSHCDEMVVIRSAVHTTTPVIILRRKLNPRDWWPRWVLADRIMLNASGVIRLYAPDGADGYWIPQASNILDFSWIPEHLRGSGMTIENPWKGEQQ